MFSLTRYTTPCPETINGQILQLVVDNLTDISSIALPSTISRSMWWHQPCWFTRRTTVSTGTSPVVTMVGRSRPWAAR